MTLCLKSDINQLYILIYLYLKPEIDHLVNSNSTTPDSTQLNSFSVYIDQQLLLSTKSTYQPNLKQSTINQQQQQQRI